MKPVIEAGAGTGKTTRIVELILEKLLVEECDAREVLALTFTVKAANEMRQRLAEWLDRLLRGERIRELGGVGLEEFARSRGARPERAEASGRRAMELLDRILISTIHGFAAHVLRQFPIEAGVPPDFEEDEGEAARALFRERWPVWLAQRAGDPATHALLGDLLLERAAETFEEDARTLVLSEGEFPRDDASSAAAYAAELEELRGRALRLVARYDKETKLRKAMEVCAAVFGGSRERVPEAGRVGSWSEEDNAEAKELMRLARGVAAVRPERVRAAIRWLLPFRKEFAREYLLRGHVSMDGLLVRTAGLLRWDGEIRSRLKRRFRVILVDEFQDTDPLQGEILLYLAEREGSFAEDWRDVVLEPGRLVLVGDPKQSIYLFRGADIEAYRLFQKRLTGDDPEGVETQTVNYRSAGPLVRFANAVCAPLLGGGGEFQPGYAPLEPFEEHREREGRIDLITFDGGSADEMRDREAAFLAEWIRRDFGPDRYGSAAILLRGLGDAHRIMDALRGRGVPFAIEGEKRFFGAPEVIDFLNLLEVIAHPRHETALAGILRSPLVGVADRELLHLSRAGALDPLEPASVPREHAAVRRFYETVSFFHDRARRMRLGEFLEELADRMLLLPVEAGTYRGEQAAANLRKLCRLGARLSRERGATLEVFLAELRRSVRLGEEEGESPLADERLNAVRIMSIHKAKGLEFATVVLPDLNRGRGGRTDRTMLREWASGRTGLRVGPCSDRTWFLLRNRHELKEEAEARRLLYVALTRAKDRLVLCGRAKSKPGTLLGLLEEGLRAAGIDPFREGRQEGEGFSIEVRRMDGAVERGGPAPVEAAEEIDARALHAAWVEREAEARRAEAGEFARASRRPEEEEAADLRAERDEQTPSRAALVGTVCHEALATLDLSRAGKDLGARVKASARAAGKGVAREALSILRPFIASDVFRRIAAADEVHREAPFVIRLDGKIYSGQIDVLYRVGGKWRVGEYKSDRIRAEEAAAAAGKYHEQRRVYTAAARSALGLKEDPAFEVIYLRTCQAVGEGRK